MKDSEEPSPAVAAPAPAAAKDAKDAKDAKGTARAVRRALKTGYYLLAVSIPFGVTLEALHGFKVRMYLDSALRRELWRLSHAHGTLLGILCLVFAALAERHVDARVRGTVARRLTLGAVLMPLGFLLGGILNGEGDPSLGVLLVPLGAVFLVLALGQAATRD